MGSDHTSPPPLMAIVAIATIAIFTLLATGCSSGGSSTTTAARPVNTAGPVTTAQTSPAGSTNSTAVTTPTTKTTASDTIKTYEDATYKYAFAYPKDWQFTEDVSVEGSAGGSSAKTVGVFDPKGDRKGDTLQNGVAISIYQLTTTVDDSLMPAFKDELASALPGLEAQLADLVTVEPLRDTSINGVLGFETTYTFTSGDKSLRSRMLFLVNGDLEYQITVQSVDGSWQKELPKLNGVLNSFRTLP